MSITTKYETDLTNSMSAAQHVSLGKRVHQYKITETIAFGDFTDGGGAVGTYVLTDGTLPIGATVLFSAVEAITGFTGDTSATIQIGDGTDADRYSTGTPNVFITVAGGITVGVVSGVEYHAVAKSITVSITSATDWGSVTAGSVTVSVYYLD